MDLSEISPWTNYNDLYLKPKEWQRFMNERKYHLTIVDDLSENLEHYESFLKEEFNLNTFNDPELALEWLKKNKTSLLILDIHMPKVSGFELYQNIKQAHLDIPVIFLTGDPSEETTLKDALILGRMILS